MCQETEPELSPGMLVQPSCVSRLDSPHACSHLGKGGNGDAASSQSNVEGEKKQILVLLALPRPLPAQSLFS